MSHAKRVVRLSTEDPERPCFAVGQVADLLGVRHAFLRQLDQLDLVRPARSEGSQRRYSRNDIDRVTAICHLIDDGLSLDGVRRVMKLQTEVEGLQIEIATLRQRRTTS